MKQFDLIPSSFCRIQQKFTLDVFKSVQSEYVEEGIQWSHIDFVDNQPVLDLIESRMGVISVLNEECVRPKGSDESFTSKIVTAHKESPYFGFVSHTRALPPPLPLRRLTYSRR